MTQTPDMPSILDSAMDRRLRGVYTCQVGSVTRYDATTQQVDVQPVVMSAYEAENGDRIAEVLPALIGIPVAFPTGGGYRLTLPIAVGDFVVVVHTHSSHDQWLVGTGAVVDPRDDRRHHLSDAVAFPAVRPFGNALQSAPTNCLSIGSDTGPTIEVDQSNVRVGGSGLGVESMVMGDSFLAAINTMVTAISTMIAGINGYVAAVAALPAPFTATVPLASTLNGIASTYVTAVSAYGSAVATFKSTIAQVKR